MTGGRGRGSARCTTHTPPATEECARKHPLDGSAGDPIHLGAKSSTNAAEGTQPTIAESLPSGSKAQLLAPEQDHQNAPKEGPVSVDTEVQPSILKTAPKVSRVATGLKPPRPLRQPLEALKIDTSHGICQCTTCLQCRERAYTTPGLGDASEEPPEASLPLKLVNSLESIKKLFTKELGSSLGMTGLIQMSVITSLATAIVSCLKDIAILCMKATGVVKVISAGSLAIGLTNAIMQIYVICQVRNYEFDIDAAMATFKKIPLEDEIPQSEDVTPSVWEKIKAWIPRITTCLTTCVVAGLGLLPSGSTIGTLIKNYSSSRKIGDDVSSFMSDFLYDVCGIHLEADPAFVKLLEDINQVGTKLLITPNHKFFVEKHRMNELMSFPARVDVITRHKTNSDTAKSLRFILQTLQNTRSKIVEKIAAMNAIMDQKRRQVTQGVYLAGAGAVGKSYFGKYLMGEVCKRLGYPTGVYNLGKNANDFYEPYQAQACGQKDEFMAQRCDDPYITASNQIVSGDYYNFEGAGLEEKTQPCQLKLAVVTSNVIAPTLTKVLAQQAIGPFWSRYTCYEVLDPRISSAEAGRKMEQPHRRPDCSHLVLVPYHFNESGDIERGEPMTAAEVILQTTKQVRDAEISYLEEVVSGRTGLEVTEELRASVLERVKKIEEIPNGKSGRVFTVRLQGALGTGKTFLATKSLIPRLLSSFKHLEFFEFEGEEPIDYSKAKLVLVDDTLSGNEKAYFKMVQGLKESSIIIITTNDVVTATKDWTSATLGRIPIIGHALTWEPKAIMPEIPGVPLGYSRRIGVELPMIVGGQSHWPLPMDVCMVTFDHQSHVHFPDRPHVARSAVIDRVIERYITFLQSSKDFTWCEEPLNVENPEVHIQARTYEDLVSVLSSSAEIIKVFMATGARRFDPRMKIFLTEEFLDFMKYKCGADEWRVPPSPLEQRDRLAIAEKIALMLYRFKPDAQTKVVIENPGGEQHLYEIRGMLGYHTEGISEEPEMHIYTERGIRYTPTQQEVTYDDAAMLQTATEFVPSYLQAPTIAYIKRTKFADPRFEHALIGANKTCNTNLLFAALTAKHIFRHPAIIAILAILGVMATGAVVYGIYKACCAGATDYTSVPNDDSSPDDPNDRIRVKMARDVFKGGKKASGIVHKKFTNSAFDKRIAEENWSIPSGPSWADDEVGWDVTVFSNSQEIPAVAVPRSKLRELVVKANHADRMSSNTVPRMLAPSEMIQRPDSPLDAMVKILEDNLALVSSPHGRNYALIVDQNYAFTVAHVCYGQDKVQLTSKGKTVDAIVMKCSVARDLAVLLIPSEMPVHKNIRKFIPPTLETCETDAWFIKPGRLRTIVKAIVHTHVRYRCMSTHKSERYNPSEWIQTFYMATMKDTSHVFRSGDCGMPLVIMKDGQYKVYAIHNATGGMGVANFASICLEDLSDITIPSSERVTKCIQYAGEEYVLSEGAAEAVSQIKMGYVTHEEAQYPIPIGHSTPMRLYSKPKHQRILLAPGVPVPPGAVPVLRYPSCLSEEDLPPGVTAPRRSKFIDGKRQPDKMEPLFLQIRKYSQRPPFTANTKTFTRAVMDVVATYRMRYKTDAKKLRPLTISETLNGTSNKAMSGFPLDTSAGPVLNRKYGIITKRELVKVDEHTGRRTLKHTPAATFVKASVAEKLESLFYGKPVLLVTKDCKKVELISQEARNKGKVRLFNEVDFDDNIVQKIMTGDLMARMLETESPALVGMNPYRMPTVANRILCGDFAKAVGTDITSMDKHLAPEMIAAVVKVIGELYGWEPGVMVAFTKTLQNPIHSFEGDVYLTEGGNLSGWFMTTMINTIAQEIIISYDRIKNAEGGIGSLTQAVEPYLVMGDDKIQVMSPSRAEAQRQSYLECGLIMQAGTKGRDSKYEEFCSRDLYFADGVAFGALKMEALSGCLHYSSSKDLDLIHSNWCLAAFEAALHRSPTIYKMVVTTIQHLVAVTSLPSPSILSREEYRAVYIRYVRGENDHLTYMADKPEDLYIKLFYDLTPRHDMKPITRLYEHAQKTGKPRPQITSDQDGPDHDPNWTSTITYDGKTSKGCGRTKVASVDAAAHALCSQMGQTPNTNPAPCGSSSTEGEQSGASNPGEQLPEVDGRMIMKRLVKAHMSVAFKAAPCIVWTEQDLTKAIPNTIRGIRVNVLDDKVYCCGKTLEGLPYSIVRPYFEREGAIRSPFSTDMFVLNDSPNNGPDTPVQGEQLEQASTNMGLATIPQFTNPQPSGQAPVMTPGPTKLVSAEEQVYSETLNPLGPPNELFKGAVEFDIKDMAYQQFLDSDRQFIITDDTPRGSILLQIPYDPMGDYVNPYIKSYVSQHERYTGSLQFRITLIGNPTFSGIIGFSWQPRKLQGNIASVSELQRFSYYGSSVELPTNTVFTLHDARKQFFYRETADSQADIDERPHLVVFTLVSLVSPLREGIQARLIVASKLGNVRDAGHNAFQVSLPRPIQAPALGSSSPLVTTTVSDLDPSLDGLRVYLATDGAAIGTTAQEQDLRGIVSSGAAYGQVVRPKDPNIRTPPGQNMTVIPCKTFYNMVVKGPGDGANYNDQWQFNSRDKTASYVTLEILTRHTDAVLKELYDKVRVEREIAISSETPDPAHEFLLRLVEDFARPSLLGEDVIVITSWSPADISQQIRVDVPPTSTTWTDTLMCEQQLLVASGLGSVGDAQYKTFQHRLVRQNSVVVYIKILTRTQVFVFRVSNIRVTSTMGGLAAADNDGPTTNNNAAGTHACGNNLGFVLPAIQYQPLQNYEADTSAALGPAATYLPAGWARLTFTVAPPTAVQITGYIGPTLSTQRGLYKALARRARNISTFECISFNLVDSVSNQVIAAVRYLQENDECVVNVGGARQYSVYPTDASEMVIQNLTVEQRSNAFPVTNTGSWIQRTSSASAQYGLFAGDFLFSPQGKMLDHVNAMAGAMAVSGMAQGLASYLQSQQQQKFQMAQIQAIGNNKLALQRAVNSGSIANIQEQGAQQRATSLSRNPVQSLMQGIPVASGPL